MGSLTTIVQAVITANRSQFLADGGDIVLHDICDNIVYIKLEGACALCPFSALHIADTLTTELKKQAPEIVRVDII